MSPTISEAREKLQEARSQVASQREAAQQQEQKIQETRKKLPDMTSQQYLRGQKGLGGLQGRQQRRQLLSAKEELKTRLSDLESYKQRLSQFETQELDTYEQQIKQAEIEANRVSQYNTALKVYLGLISGGSAEFQAVPEDIKTEARLKAEQLERQYAQQYISENINSLQEQYPDMEFTPNLKDYTIAVADKLKNIQYPSIEAYNKSVAQGGLQEKQEVKPLPANILDTTSLFLPVQIEINPTTGKPYGEISESTKPEGLGFFGGLSYDLARESEKRRQRGQDFKDKTIGLFAGAGSSVLGTLAYGEQLVKSPIKTGVATAKGGFNVGLGLATGTARFPEAGRILREDPTFGLGFVAAEGATAIGAGKVAKVSKDFLVSKGTELFDPRFRSSATGIIEDIQTSKGAIDIEIGGGVKSLEEPLSSQAKLAGTTTDAVSGQRGLFNIFERNKIVDKPLPSPDAPPLERSFFADPRGRLRPSRLGILEENQAGLLDVLSGDVTFRRGRPQGLLFPEAQIERFPTYLRDVEQKLLRNKPLSANDQARLLEWQLQQSGKFKPVGFLSREPEVTLAPGETIVKKKTAVVTTINNKRVPIFEVEIGQASKSTSKLLEDLKSGTISQSELKELIKKLKKETGIDYSSALSYGKKYVSPTALGGAALSLLSGSTTGKTSSPSLLASSSPAPSGSSNIFLNDGYSPLSLTGTSPSPIPSGSPDIIFSPFPSPPPSSPAPSPPVNPPYNQPPVGSPPLPPPPKRSRGLSLFRNLKEKTEQGYDVGIVEGGKPKIIKKGLYKNDARDVGAKEVLKTVAATLFLRKSKQKPKDIPDTNVFQRFQNQFRPPTAKSKLKDLGEEVWIQKKRKVQGQGSRLGQASEVRDILGFKDSGFSLGFGKSKKKSRKKKKKFNWF